MYPCSRLSSSTSVPVLLSLSVSLSAVWSAVLTREYLLSRVKKGTHSLSTDTLHCSLWVYVCACVWVLVLVHCWVGVEKLIGVGCRCVCMCVCAYPCLDKGVGSFFFFFNSLSKALPAERGNLGWPPPAHRYEAVMGRIAAFIEWHLFSPTLHKCSEQNRQGSSWGRHFLRLRRQWQTCSNYFKSKQTPRKLPSLLSFVTSFEQAAWRVFFLCLLNVMCVCVCIHRHI